ncbi:uncharacterized protein [Nicotiana tomentosiformis]|uniref:uncharacterized protein isoform X2 n=1 Tax=Nicotiana tomentosiformis TaxID=4098 RepID=UPI00051B1273|nr:uncharacterized protein LOC104100494 isoform X2 [Nicotiana tomentosiformis]
MDLYSYSPLGRCSRVRTIISRLSWGRNDAWMGVAVLCGVVCYIRSTFLLENISFLINVKIEPKCVEINILTRMKRKDDRSLEKKSTYAVMVRTRTTGQDGQPPVPPTRVARGRGRGRGSGRGAARTAARVALVDPLVAPDQEQVLDTVEPVEPAQAPTVPTVILGLQKALAQILTVCTGLVQAVSVPAATDTSQVGGGTQTPAARTPEQVMQGLQIPGVLLAHPVATAQA